MTDDPSDDRLQQFLEQLRAESGRGGPGSGLGRFARTARGAVGIAANLWRMRGRPELDERGQLKIEHLAARLGELKGIPMKVGQILGFLEVDLPPEMQRILALLQTQSPAMPFSTVQQVIREELGDRSEAMLAGVEEIPISIASIGQVHRARLPGGEQVAVKVRHPGIEEAIRSDFRGAVAGTAFAKLIVPGAGSMARDFVKEAEARFLEECDYLLEADRQRLFGRLFADHPVVVVPRVLDDWCGRRVLTTVWEEGRDFDTFAGSASQSERDRAGLALFDVYVGTLYRHSLFHADPHPGNYRFREDGRVVVFDYGCVRCFEPSDVVAFVDLAESVRSGDEAQMRLALGALGAAPPKNARAFARIRKLLEGFFGPMLKPGAHRIDGRVALDARQLAGDKLAVARMRLPGKLLFLFRIRFGLYSVLARLGSVCDWSAVEMEYAAAARSRSRSSPSG
ncbi:MAG: AarF/ABC1/UbiB kinase family protein [Bradymonadales bacterium]|nr:AarF/ABC1/UbiB kinase family protein [Bradymonadales bacterium]